VKEHGLLMSAPLVRAILAGRKKVTRRLSKRHDAWKVGDRIWVRETWAMRSDTEPGSDKAKHYLRYRADGGDLADEWHDYGQWRPSLLMPRWASRILLEVTEPVRVERAHDITDDEAWREGIEELDGSLDERELCRVAKEMGACAEDARVWFAVLWQQINNKPPKPGKPDARWEANPEVRRIAFKVLGKP
jgi:hypothetical protein